VRGKSAAEIDRFMNDARATGTTYEMSESGRPAKRFGEGHTFIFPSHSHTRQLLFLKPTLSAR
jgi:hypothetical protein